MINTPRLTIRRFQEQDYPALYEYLSDPSIYQYEPGGPISLEKAHELAIERARSNDFWAVVLNSTGELVGHIFFAQTEPQELMTWELGYIINPRFQNQGYATEAVHALFEYGFANWHIHRVVAHCNPENIASWKVMEKLGMKREGHFRKNIFFRMNPDGSPCWVDTYEYALLKEDL